jgi:hypothetical protein
MLFLVTLFQVVMIFLMLLYAQSAHAWNVPFNPQAPEIQASKDSSEVLEFINTFIGWVCALISVYLAYKAMAKLNSSEGFGSFLLTLAGAFIAGGASYFSQYFVYH